MFGIDKNKRLSLCDWLPDEMYVTTFYSFKGGVGRTMALVNAAVELANTGRRVLVVDFDLEAPGLDTFDILHSETQVPGIVDFVSEYIASGQAPEVTHFIGKSPGIGDKGGGLWIMPSGAHHKSYATNFSQIDWGMLYERHDGYLLFEDLKEQWKQTIKPDYVLIDSRTGHTDTGGICTRQLPDAVAIFFFPNEQNLRGLTKIVRDIRAEAEGPRKKEIELHFVMSNVPDLDDEDKILEEQIEEFQNQLGFKREPMIVHRYNSLALLNQAVFTKDRPRSRLAQEYRDVVQEIVRWNIEDREGALDYIRRLDGNWSQLSVADENLEEITPKLTQIGEAHSNDGEVVFNLGVLFEAERNPLFFDRAIEAGYDKPEVYWRRARLRADNDDLDGASKDALKVLQSDNSPSPLVRDAIVLAMRGSSISSIEVLESRAVRSLGTDERLRLAEELGESPEEIRVTASILQSLADDNTLSDEQYRSVKSKLTLAYIGSGECAKAIELFSDRGRHVGDMGSLDAFSYGMAVWGDTHHVDSGPFTRVVELDQADLNPPDIPTYFQSMAVAYWACGDVATALKSVRKARAKIDKIRSPVLSCWRYYRVGPKAFIDDLNEIVELIKGDESRIPRFMVAASEPEKNGHSRSDKRE